MRESEKMIFYDLWKIMRLSYKSKLKILHKTKKMKNHDFSKNHDLKIARV